MKLWVAFHIWRIVTNLEFFIVASLSMLWLILLCVRNNAGRYGGDRAEKAARFLQGYVLVALVWSVFIISKRATVALLSLLIGAFLNWASRKYRRRKKALKAEKKSAKEA